MKLNTLLLASAATMVVSSAFAADLPSKKAAPASGSVQVCKVGGMTGMMLPGSDTCLSIGGRVTFDASYDLDSASDDGDSDSSFGAGYRIGFDARTNTEMGVVRSFIQLEGGSVTGQVKQRDYYYGQYESTDVAKTRRAYIQFAGLTVGKKDSLADVYGTQSNQLGLATQQNVGVDYRVSAGGLSFAVGLEKSNDNNYLYDYGSTYDLSSKTADRPDIVAQMSGSAGPLNFTVAGVSHEAYDDEEEKGVNGWALLGNINAKFDSVGVFAFGGMADAAGQYIAANSSTNRYNYYYLDAAYTESGYDTLKSSVIGGGINFTMGKTFVNIEAARYEHEDGYYEETLTVDQFDVYLSHTLAKGLTIQPEYLMTKVTDGNDSDNDGTTHAVYLRIQKDF